MQPVPQRYVCIVGTCFMDIPSQIGSSGATICSLDVIDAYMSQLQQYNAIATCDDSLRLFVVQDFSPESLSLKVINGAYNYLSLSCYFSYFQHQYCFVSRSVRQFADAIEWVYVCSCDPNASDLYNKNSQYSH